MPSTLARRTLLLCLAIWLAAAPAWAAGDKAFSQLVIFGDSLSDPGNAFVLTGELSLRPFQAIPEAPYAIGGLHLSNGKTWVEQLAKTLGLARDARPAFRAPSVFSNYAVGGARARDVGLMDLTDQVEFFFSVTAVPIAAESLYVVWLGGNDVRDALEALTLDPNGVASALIINQAVTAISHNIAALAAAGARTFLVPNAPNIGLLPAVADLGSGAVNAAGMLSTQFNGLLDGALASLEYLPDIAIIRLNVFDVVNETVGDPDAAGLSNVEDSCITPDVVRGAICKKPSEYLFWDGVHPTRAGHAILAAAAEQCLSVPRPEACAPSSAM